MAMQEDIFITKLHINNVRHLKDIEIPISETERKHLILTGKNGSGKTSTLEAIRLFFESIENNQFFNLIYQWKSGIENDLKNLQNLQKKIDSGQLSEIDGRVSNKKQKRGLKIMKTI